MVDNQNDSVQEVIDIEEAHNESGAELQFLQNQSVDEYCKKVMGIIRTCQKCSTEIQGWHHYTDYSGVQYTMTRINKLLNTLVSKIFSHQDIKLSINGYKLIDQFEIIREGNDALLERISSDLDEAFGIRRNTGIEIVDSTVRTIRGPVNQDSGREMVLLASRNVQKPQLFFTPKIDNSDKEPFIPLIKEKPNSLKPLSILICINPGGQEYYSHPYEYELQHWSPPDSVLVERDPILPFPMNETPFQLIENDQSLTQMVQELMHVREIAVDLEHHSFRTYQGLTCLIQISTREKDYIIDPFPTRNQLPLLNEVFTNPKITKVFHGADQDVLWLQRDCGVYVVNMFDTHQAAIVLEYPHRSLANLLYQFCQLAANKTYQRADWRIRPLPDDFITYARQDSHFLLYIYDIMRNELIDKGNEFNNLLHATYSRSTELCLKRYEKPIVGPDSYVDVYRRSRKQFNRRQLYALQNIYLWRDRIARQQDESVDFVLPKHMMLQMAEVLPKEMQGILACCNPIPPLVKTEQLTLHQIIRAAREIKEEELQITPDIDHNLNELRDARDTHSTLVCKHDLTLVEDEPRGLSTLLNPQETLLGDLFSQNPVRAKLKNKSSLFGLRKQDLWCKRIQLNATTTEFMSPYERYKTLLENQTTFDEPETPQPEPAPVGDELRIQKIKSYFLSLNASLPASSAREEEEGEEEEEEEEEEEVGVKKEEEEEEEEENEEQEVQDSKSDLDRLARLQNHIMNLSMEAQTEAQTSKKQQSPRNANRRRKRGKQFKRRSGEAALDDNESNKRMKNENMKDGDQRSTDGGSDVKPFDYSQANYNIFHSKKFKKTRKQNFRQNFRGKGSRPPGFKKTGMKNIAWGNDKRK